jgi:predicted DNA-binding protein YlxM (UPF0122 family)
MSKGKPDEKQKAYDLYCNTELSQKDIAAVVGVSVQHMNKWVKQGNWEIYRTAGKVTLEKIIHGYYVQLAAINEEISKQDNIPTNAQNDSICKITSSINTLQKKYNLSAYHSVLRELIEWLMTTDINAAKVLGPLMLEFLKDKAKSLSDDKAR